MDNRQRLEQIIGKQQDLVRDFQYCLNTSEEGQWKDFFGTMAREQGELAHRCLDRIRKG
jgi:hypothetical protein